MISSLSISVFFKCLLSCRKMFIQVCMRTLFSIIYASETKSSEGIFFPEVGMSYKMGSPTLCTSYLQSLTNGARLYAGLLTFQYAKSYLTSCIAGTKSR